MTVDRDNQSMADYLLKILTIVVNKAGGELRIAAVDMIDDSTGGLTKAYDRDKKELVLRYISSSTEVIRPCAITESPSSTMLQRPASSSSQRSSIVRPLQISAPTDSLDSANDSQQPSSQSRQSSTLDDQRIADLEDHLRKEAASRILANFPSTPVTQPRREPLSQREPAKPRQSQLREQFFRG